MTAPNHFKEGLLSFDYDCDELNCTLTCWFEYEAPERGSREPMTGLQLEPDYPATLTLHHVYLPGSHVDIAPVLSLKVVAEIETWVADHAAGYSE
jgi:hypothetical protein